MRPSGWCFQKASTCGSGMEIGLGRVGKKESGERPGMGLGLLSLVGGKGRVLKHPACICLQPSFPNPFLLLLVFHLSN